MPRPGNKEDLMIAATTNYEKLLTLIENRTENEKSICYDFSADEKKKEAHWKRWIHFQMKNYLLILIIHGLVEAVSVVILSVPQAVTMIGQ